MEGEHTHPSAENKIGMHFSKTSAAFFLLLVLSPGVICVTFYDWSAAHSFTNRCYCLRKKMPSFILGLNGHRVNNMKLTLLDLSFSVAKEQKIVAAEE